MKITIFFLMLSVFPKSHLLAQGKSINSQMSTSSLLKFKAIDSKGTIKTFEKGKPLMLVYFRTDCEDCNRNIRSLSKMAKDYPVQIWMVSPEPVAELQVFNDMYALYDLDNLEMMQDYTTSMHDWFDFKYLPFIVLYNASGKEIQRFEELPQAQTIQDLLK